MVKQKKSRRLGLLTEKETQFLYLTEKEQKKRYRDGTRKYFQRIVGSADQGFQDYGILIARLPKKYRDKIDFLSGLRDIERSLTRVKATEQIPHRIIEPTLDSLDKCLEIIKKQHNPRLEKIAKKDFEKVIDWLYMAQKYPKPLGAEI